MTNLVLFALASETKFTQKELRKWLENGRLLGAQDAVETETLMQALSNGNVVLFQTDLGISIPPGMILDTHRFVKLGSIAILTALTAFRLAVAHEHPSWRKFKGGAWWRSLLSDPYMHFDLAAI